MTTLAQHVDAASESIRQANHATMRASLDAPEAYVVVGGLAELAARLPQLLDYLSRSLRRADPAEHYDDRDGDPAQALCLAHGHLADARSDVAWAAHQLHAVHNHLGHLGRHPEED